MHLAVAIILASLAASAGAPDQVEPAQSPAPDPNPGSSTL